VALELLGCAPADEGSTGVEAMLQALHFYYRMHNDLSYEVKMLGVEGVCHLRNATPAVFYSLSVIMLCVVGS
jgi:hypothetical protein